MIDYTPYYKYKEVVNAVSTSKNLYKKIFSNIVFGTCLFLLYYFSGFGIITLIVISFFSFLAYMLYYFFSFYEPPTKAEISKPIKNVIGYDFGLDFKILSTGGHDYEEYLYIFSEETFTPLREHLESIPETGDIESDKGRVVRHSFKGLPNAGFYLSDRRMEGVCGNIETIEVDYSERTLKHTFVVY